MRLLLFCVFVLAINPVFAQTMRFSHLDQKQGLSQNSPDCFLQDSEGFMWIGTQDGLNRYDGYSFTVMRTIPGDSASLVDNFILSLAEDSDKNIWIGTRNGICVYVKSDARFYRYRSKYDDPKNFHASVSHVSAIREGGVIYRTTTSQMISVKYNSAAHQIEATDLVDEKLVACFAYEPLTGDLAFVNPDGIHIGQPGKATIHHSIAFKTKSNVAMSFDGEHLYVNDSVNILHIQVSASGLSTVIYSCDSRVTCLATGPDHSLWIGTIDGIRVIHSPVNSPRIETATEDKQDYFGLHGNRTECVFRTKENTMWIGTVGGINIYDPLQKRFSVTAEEQLPGAIWFTCSAGNVIMLANDKELKLHSESPLPEWTKLIPENLSYSAAQFDSKSRLWLGTKNQGLIIIDTLNKTADKRFIAHPAFAESNIMDFSSVSGKMWIASIGSLCVVDENDLSIQTIRSPRVYCSSIPTTYFSSIESDGNSRVFVGTAKGVAIFERPDTVCSRLSHDPANENSLIYDIVNDLYYANGELWIATMGSGLDRYTIQSEKFTHYSTSNGLANNTIYGIEPAGNAELWLSSNEGLIQFQTNTGLSRNFVIADGLQSNEFVINKHCRRADSEFLYFGSADGLVAFSPAAFRDSAANALPVLTQLSVNYSLRNHYSNSTLDLNPDERNVSFEFAVIDFRNSDKFIYAYQLTGYDTTWHETSTDNRTANFTNLPYGNYTFRVKYKISGGEWSEAMLEYPFTIQTPFYATTWFLVVVIISGILIVAIVVRYISQRRLRQQVEELKVQEKIRSEKERISRDLHDNVGAQLTYVISSLDNLSYTLNRNPEPVKTSAKLEQLGEFARGTMDQLRESIWAINAESISLSELAGRWKQYLAQLSESRPEFTGTVTVHGTDNLLKPTVAIEIHRIVQEAINNAFKHSGGNHLEVNVFSKGPFTIRVKDNGKGFDGTAKEGHYGIKNMKERAKLIGGWLEFRGSESGTEVSLFIIDGYALP